MKISFEFGRRGQHSVRKQNEMLLMTIEVLTEKLRTEQEARLEIESQLRDALSDRVARGHQMRQGLQVINGGQARFQLEG